MAEIPFDQSVFVNCPFDEQFSHLLEAMAFCLVSFGLSPRLANESLDAGENRLDKIVHMIKGSMYSIHDLSRCKSEHADEFFRMNMPFEFGVDLGLLRSGSDAWATKKFLIFEENPYDLKQAISDIAGQDVAFHHNRFERVIENVRHFFSVEANYDAPGTSLLISEYATFQGWLVEKKVYEGHSLDETMRLPSKEKIDEMRFWGELGKPSAFSP